MTRTVLCEGEAACGAAPGGGHVGLGRLSASVVCGSGAKESNTPRRAVSSTQLGFVDESNVEETRA
jgi:hypothetical protein